MTNKFDLMMRDKEVKLRRDSVLAWLITMGTYGSGPNMTFAKEGISHIQHLERALTALPEHDQGEIDTIMMTNETSGNGRDQYGYSRGIAQMAPPERAPSQKVSDLEKHLKQLDVMISRLKDTAQRIETAMDRSLPVDAPVTGVKSGASPDQKATKPTATNHKGELAERMADLNNVWHQLNRQGERLDEFL